MAEIYVKSSGDLDNVIMELEGKREAFITTANDVINRMRNMPNKWTGEASDAFLQNFGNEYSNFQTFADTLGEFIQGLRDIKARYEQAEEKAINIGTTKS